MTATDDSSSAVTDTFALTVNSVNDAPVMTDIEDQRTKEGSSFADIILDNYVSDEDNSDSEITWTFSGNTNLVVVVDTNRVMHVTAEDADWFGSEKIYIKATDPGTLTAIDSALFTVTPVNDAPVIVNLPDEVSFTSDSTVVIPVSGLATDIDSPQESLVWSFEASNDSVIIQYNNILKVVSISAPGFKGDVEIYGTVTDDSSASDTDTILVHVELVTALDNFYSGRNRTYKLGGLSDSESGRVDLMPG